MTGTTRRRNLLVATAAAAILAVLTIHSANLHSDHIMTNRNEKVVPIFAQTKTVCIGRFLIDVPLTAEVVYGPSHVGWEITRLPDAAGDASAKVQARLDEIEAQRYIAEKDRFGPDSMYGKSLDGQARGQKLVFGRSDGVSYQVDSYIQLGKDLYIQEAYPLLAKESYTNAISDLNSVATRLRARADAAIPDESGVCIDGAFVADGGKPGLELVTIGVRLAEFNDVHFSMSMTKKNIVVQSDALAPRLAQAEQEAAQSGHAAWYSRIKILRKGERKIGNWNGFEVLARKPAQEGAEESHEFAFVSQGEPKNPLLPVLDVQLNTGVQGNQTGARKPSVSDDEAVEIWDKLVSTIRVRPTGSGGITSAPLKPATPLGSVAMGGARCGTSGWWQCTDGMDKVDVSGGRVQYLRAGQTVPQALLLPPATPWQKLRGEQPTFQSEIPSSWKLVDRRKNARSAPPTLLVPAGASQRATSDEVAKPEIDLLAQQASSVSGTQLTSGEICSASGWWQCLEADALDNTRWFSSGALLPPATKPVSLTVLEKMKGVPGCVRVSATWRFIRFADSETPVSTEGRATSVASSNEPDKDGSDLPEGV